VLAADGPRPGNSSQVGRWWLVTRPMGSDQRQPRFMHSAGCGSSLRRHPAQSAAICPTYACLVGSHCA
jgi:hypothetical protein